MLIETKAWDQPGPSSRPPVFIYTPAPRSTLTMSGETTTGDKNLVEWNVSEPNSAQGLGLDA